MAAEDLTPDSPFPSWEFDEVTNNWVAPIAMPTDGRVYMWDEAAYQINHTSGWLALNGE